MRYTLSFVAATATTVMKDHVVKSIEIAEQNWFLSAIPRLVRSIGHQMYGGSMFASLYIWYRIVEALKCVFQSSVHGKHL